MRLTLLISALVAPLLTGALPSPQHQLQNQDSLAPLSPRSDASDTTYSPLPPSRPTPAPSASSTPPPCTPSPTSNHDTRALWDKFSYLLWNQSDALGAYAYAADSYIQHNPFIPDGRDATLDILVALLPTVRISRLFRGYDEGLGWAHYRMDGYMPEPVALVDVFRWEGGCIVEHWDVMEGLPWNATNPHPLW